MADSIMPEVKISLGGRERRLVFDFNAQAAFEEATGLSVFDKKVLGSANAPPSQRVVRAMLWAQLLHEDPKVSFDEFGRIVDPPELSMTEVGALITSRNVTEVGRAVYKAFSLFFKPEEKGAAAADKEEAAKNA